MNKFKQLFLGFGVIAFIAGCAGGNANSPTESVKEDGYRRVGRVAWHKEKSIDFKQLSQKVIPNNNSSIFFYRVADNDGLQTSANVAINGRFQVSLQPGYFSQVYSCAGVNNLSVSITGRKNNDLRNGEGVLTQNLDAGKNYYFVIDVDDMEGIDIKFVADQVAIKAMTGMPRQTHQISRIVPNCPNIAESAHTEM